MTASELWRLDAAELAPLIASGTVSSREAIASALARLDAVNPAINAVVRPLHASALAAADAADARQRRGDALGPLHGVPVTIKVNTDQRGEPTDNGVVAYKDVIATEDAPVVANLLRAGAIVVGRTNTPCYSMRWFTANDLHGETWNPWTRRATPGGSSGGAGAAVAAGIGAIAQGNDIAGSVRYPAYCCGVVGLRPSYGRIPSFNPSALAPQPISAQLMAVQGPLARRVRDVRLAFAAMSAPDARDPRVVVLGDQPPPPRPLRAAVLSAPGGRAVHPGVAEAITQACAALTAAGYVVEEAQPPEFIATAELWGAIGGPDTMARLEPLVAANGDAGIRRNLAFWRKAWPHLDPAMTLAALAERARILRLWHGFFTRYPVLVTPVSHALPYPPDEDLRDEATAVAMMYEQAPMLAISVLGLPAVSVPTGVHDGIPVGVQIVAGHCREDLCLDAAAAVEAHRPMSTPVDPRG